MTRDEVVAARKERRAKGRVQERPAGAGASPGRYRKRRPDAPVVRVVDVEPPVDAGVDDEESMVDPLDAQRAGMHDEQLALGHEEVTLNLDEPNAPPEGAANEQEATAAKPER
jgi:hypothetical protein